MGATTAQDFARVGSWACVGCCCILKKERTKA